MVPATAVARFWILGPIEVASPQRNSPVHGPRQLALLAFLIVNANRTVSTDQLIDAVWRDQPMQGAVKRVHVAVARLRATLDRAGEARGGGRLRTVTGGYLLAVAPGELDADLVRALIDDGRRALGAGRPLDAAISLRRAIAMWRGPPLADVAFVEFAQAEIRRLEELRLDAVELAIDADLASGRHREVLTEIESLMAERPLRERPRAQQMLALYRAGRQAEALAAFHELRRTLLAELGIEPGPDIRALHEALLRQDPALDVAPEIVELPPDLVVAAPARDVMPPRVTPGRRNLRLVRSDPAQEQLAPAQIDRRAEPWLVHDDPPQARRSSLPAAPNRTIGRDDEVARIGERLRAGSVRLLTLTGPGGVGKTRLALEAARLVEAEFADGAHFISLDSVRRSRDVPVTIAATLEVVLLAGEPADEAVARFLADRRGLLVIDNCEQVLGAAPFVGRLLASCPRLTVLATSREPLALRAEERRPVPPLGLPPADGVQDHAELARVDAVALFCERARARDPEFELNAGNAGAVASICRRLDGLPLAIELAAAGCGLLSAVEIAARLDTTVGVLGAGARDAPARQQTLWATLDWSHQLLSDDERACFARFAVFAGGATVAAAEAVTGAGLQTLELLVAKSLLVRRRRADSPTRLGMLETVRAYARERLAATPDRDAVRERHYRYFLALAEREGTERALWGTGGKTHLARLDADIDNLRAALGWAVAQTTAQPALALAAELETYWLMRARYAEADYWIGQATSLPGVDAHPALRVRALCVRATSLWALGRVAEQPAVMADAEAVARDLADPLTLFHMLHTRVAQEVGQGRPDVAARLADEALGWASLAADDWATAMAAYTSANAARGAAELRERVDRAEPLLRAAGNVYYVADLLVSAVYPALCYGGDRDAIDFASRATPLARELDNPYLWMVLRGNFAVAAVLTGDTDAAADAFREELALCRELVVLPIVFEGLNGLAAVAAARDDLPRAARLLGAATAHRYAQAEDPVATRLRAGFFEPARTRCPQDTWAAAVREGAALSFHEAIAYALEEPPA